jgi:hypothetical protein
MRKLMAAAVMALPLSLGCQTTGGICDCAPIPGDSVGYNPHVIYHATCPWGGATPHAAAPATGVSSTGDASESTAAPRPMPMR